ncbi:MAG: hypothetical protein ABSG53_16125 [Thermoguttaceae bacterium]
MSESGQGVGHVLVAAQTSMSGSVPVGLKAISAGNSLPSFRRLNIHSSEELDKAIADAESAMRSPGLFGGTVSRDELKDSAGLRAAVATKLSAAMASIEGMMVNQPRRAINRRQAEK